jgi:hypothetical protein
MPLLMPIAGATVTVVASMSASMSTLSVAAVSAWARGAAQRFSSRQGQWACAPIAALRLWVEGAPSTHANRRARVAALPAGASPGHGCGRRMRSPPAPPPAPAPAPSGLHLR